jgi:MFS family permease
MIATGARKGIFYGWWVAIACSVIYGLSSIGHYATSIFFPFMSAEMGWTEADLGMVFSVYLWVFVGAGFLAGYLVDRIGGRKTFIIGAIIGCTGLVLLSTINSLTQVLVYYSVITSVGIALQLVVPTQAVARKWFVKRAGLVAGIIAATFGVAAAVLFPLLTQLAAAQGWHSTLWQCAIGVEAIVILLAVFVVRDTPESIGLRPNGASEPIGEAGQSGEDAPAEPYYSLKQALKTPQVWLIAISIGFAAMVVVTFIGHLTMWGLKVGIESAATGQLMTAWAIPSIIARLVGGWLGDKLGKRPVLIGACAILVGVMIYGWLGVHDPSSLYAFSIAGGFFMIVPVVLATPFLGDLFGRRYLGTIGGFLGIIGGLITGFGPWLWGYIAATTGSYNRVLLYMAIGYVISCICVAFIRPTEVEKETILKSHNDRR